jgi:hypothetical protein
MYAFPLEEKINWEELYLPNIPLFKSRLSQKIIDRLWSYIDKATIEFNHTLTGNITKSLQLHDEENYILNNILQLPIKEMCDYKKLIFHGLNHQCLIDMNILFLPAFG